MGIRNDWIVPINKKGKEDWICPECGHEHTSCCGNSHFPCTKSPQYGGKCKCGYFDKMIPNFYAFGAESNKIYPQVPNILEEEVTIWLAGLLSTDGSVSPREKISCKYYIHSRENDWLELIRTRLAGIGLTCKISKINTDKARFSDKPYYCLNIHDPENVTQLLKKHAYGFMSPRKWKIIQDRYPHKIKWRSKEAEFIKENWKKMPDKEMAKILDRTTGAVQKYRREELGLNKGVGGGIKCTV